MKFFIVSSITLATGLLSSFPAKADYQLLLGCEFKVDWPAVPENKGEGWQRLSVRVTLNADHTAQAILPDGRCIAGTFSDSDNDQVCFDWGQDNLLRDGCGSFSTLSPGEEAVIPKDDTSTVAFTLPGECGK